MEPQASAFDTYFDQILAERTVFYDEPPSLQYFDEQIDRMRGSTFALDLRRCTLQTQQISPRPTYEQRLVEMLKQNSSYKRELRFFRAVYQAMEKTRECITSIIQDLILNYYIRPSNTGQADSQWLQLADELDNALQRYTSVVNEAAKDWVHLEQYQRQGFESGSF